MTRGTTKQLTGGQSEMIDTDQTLTLTPSYLRLTVDGTAVECSDWDQATKILANQARIHNAPVTVTVLDQEPAVTGTWTVDENAHLLDASRPTDQSATMTLHDWRLAIPGRGFASFAELGSATSRIEALAEATGKTINVRILGATPSGDVTQRFVQLQSAVEEHVQSSDAPDPTKEEDVGSDDLALLLLQREDKPSAECSDLTPDADSSSEEPTEFDDENDRQSSLPIEDSDDGSDRNHDPLTMFDTGHQDDEPRPAQNSGRIMAVALVVLILLVGLLVMLGVYSPFSTPSTPWGQSTATDPAPAVSVDQQTIAAATSTGVVFVDARSGNTISTFDTVISERSIYPLGESAFYLTAGAGADPTVCARETDNGEFACTTTEPAPEEDTFVHRAGTIATITGDDDAIANVINTDGRVTEFHRPEARMAFIGQFQDRALWASNARGGQVANANPNGSVETTARLSAPAKAQEISSWFGPTSTGDLAVLWTTDDSDRDVLALHDPLTGDLSAEAEIAHVDDQGMKRLTDTGNAALAGNTLVNLTTMSTHDINPEDLENPQAQASGFLTQGEYLTAQGQLLPADQGTYVTTLDGETLSIIDGHLAVTSSHQ